ncbi:MAG TPA: hypothetical protein VH206_09665 [Xanthobacteraceae bacterium]|jgi:hypothetical protein|nr:hypothetical protein [Xanthobacteraceae bacterium]
MAAKRRALTRSKTKKRALVTRQTALRLLRRDLADALHRYYDNRFAKSFKIAVLFSGGLPGAALEQIRNAYDHVSKATGLTIAISELTAPGSRKEALKIDALYTTAKRHITRAQRHTELGNHRNVEFTICKVYNATNELLRQLGDDYVRRIEDEDSLDELYGTYLDMPKPSIARARPDDALAREIESTQASADLINGLLRDILVIYDRSDRALRTRRSPTLRTRAAEAHPDNRE